MQRVIEIVFMLLFAALLSACDKGNTSLENDLASMQPANAEHEKCPSSRCPVKDEAGDGGDKVTIAGPDNPIGKIYNLEKIGPRDKGKEAPESELLSAYVKMDEGPIPKLADSIDLTSVPGRMTNIAEGDEKAKSVEKVLVMREDLRWYLADLVQPGDDKLELKFADGEKKSVNRRFIRPVLKAAEEMVQVGDDYLINRNSDGIFYLATLIEHNGQRLEVVYLEDLEHGTVHIKDAVFFSPWPRIAPRAQFGGQPVLALWNDGRYYKGVTLEVQGDKAGIRFADGHEEKLSVERTRVLIVPDATLLNPGTILMADRNRRGAYSAAWLIEAKGQMVNIQYLDDGSLETLPVSSLAQY